MPVEGLERHEQKLRLFICLGLAKSLFDDLLPAFLRLKIDRRRRRG